MSGTDQPEPVVPDHQPANIFVEPLEVGDDLPVLLRGAEPDPKRVGPT